MADQCPSQSEIADYLQGRLSDQSSDQIHAHLDACRRCQEVVSRLDSQTDDVIERLRRQRLGQQDLVQGNPVADRTAVGVDQPPPDVADASESMTTVVYRSVKPRIRGDRYLLKRFHARGGMGEIWLAEDTEIGRQVAVKKMRNAGRGDQDRFLAEAQIAGQLEHPAIVPVHDLGLDEDNNTFYVMKFVQGQTLKAAIDNYHNAGSCSESQRKITWSQLLRHFLSLCHAVAYAHSRGVIHRDIKPDNVMLGPFSETLVLDWGLAKILHQPDAPGANLAPLRTKSLSSDDTHCGSIIGAPPYMSPELAEGRGAEAGPTTDVYLLGATLYHLLTGQPPRRGTSRDEMLELARTVPPVPPRKINKRIGRNLEAVCLKAMSHWQKDRYQSASELADEIQRYLADEPVLAFPEPVFRKVVRWTKRHQRSVLRAAALTIIVGLASFAYAVNLRVTDLSNRQLARDQVEQFQQLTEKARYAIANLNPEDERVPYYDVDEGLASAHEANRLFNNWGPNQESIAVEFDQAFRENLGDGLYDLLLLQVQVRLADVRNESDVTELLAMLENASELRKPTHSYYRLQAELYRELSDESQAITAERLARNPKTARTASDHFLAGEALRVQTFELVGAENDQPDLAAKRKLLLENAAAEYQSALQLDPRHYWSHYQLGRCWLGLHRLPQAMATLSSCIAMRPDSPWAYNTRGLTRALSGDHKGALVDLNRAKQLDADFQPAVLNLGVVHFLQGEYEGAVPFLESARSPRQGTPLIEASYYLGEIRLMDGERELAAEAFRQVTQERPRFRRAWLRLAESEFLLGNDGEGMKAIDDLIRHCGDDSVEILSAHGRELRGKYLRTVAAELSTPLDRVRVLNLAAKELQTAIDVSATADRFDELAEIQMNAARSAKRDQQKQLVRQAIDNCTLGLELDPNHIDLLDTRGYACYSLGQQSEAAADYERITKIALGSLHERLLRVQAHNLLGYFKAVQQDTQSALNEAALAELAIHDLSTEQKADNYLLHHNLACIYAELSKSSDEHRVRFEDLAIRYLLRGIEVARQKGELDLRINNIRDEPAFTLSLKQRAELAEFRQQLLP